MPDKAGDEAWASLSSGLGLFGFAEPDAVARRLLIFGEAVISSNRETNLVGAKSLEDLVAAHFLDSLAPIVGCKLREPVADIGSGAGFPGLVAAIAYPALQFVLFEGRAKRADFLRRTVEILELSNVDVTKMRAETAGRSGWREQVGTVLMRAVAPPRVALELGIPLLRGGGEFILYVGRKGEPDFEELAIANLLGAALKDARPVVVPLLHGERHVWVFRKVGRTPSGLPRQSGTPARRPLSLADCST
ncbi:MAG: 16S rRNA (guanine(527)-N(7))-methyltransferase RsmG [Candidatus Eremiobacteraeota bacterium]|nr:16S rRNA (guanine(527)-N(7))-methyltransferase RsmG [Candidatus Eremiobacteraeota bacterium]MBC5826338.1 16S rRNA (guanine(527)-N(7))-methyltransferase RsmG [Candidatus Eremiobacteraeota bacterium]